MTRHFIATLAALAIASTSLTGCNMMGMAGGSASGEQASPSLAAQTSIIALQTWLMVQQTKASEAGDRLARSNPTEAARQRARATSAGSIMTSLGTLRTESNCARRLSLATAVSGGLQAEFPNYQTELGLGTNLVTILAAGFPGCQ